MELIFLSAWRRRRRPKRKVLLGKNDSTEIDDGKITSPHGKHVFLFVFFWSIGYLWISEIDPNRLVLVCLPFSLFSAFKKSSNHIESQDVTAFLFSLFLSAARKVHRMQDGLVPFGWNFTAARETMVRHGMEQPRTWMSGMSRISGVLTCIHGQAFAKELCQSCSEVWLWESCIILQYWMMRCSGSYRLSAIHCLIITGDLDCKSLPRFDELRNEWHPSILETRESLLRRILFTSFDPLGRYLDSYGIGTVGCAFTSAHHHKIGSDRSINPSWSSKRNGDSGDI